MRAVINVLLMILSIHRTGQVSSCSHFHVGTKAQKNLVHCMWSNFSNLTSGNRTHRHAGVTKRPFSSNIFPHRRTGIQQREKLIWCGLTHSNTVTYTRGSHSSACPETQPLAGCSTGSRALWKVFPWWGCSALVRSYTTPSHEETKFLRMILNSFPSPDLGFEFLFP